MPRNALMLCKQLSMISLRGGTARGAPVRSSVWSFLLAYIPGDFGEASAIRSANSNLITVHLKTSRDTKVNALGRTDLRTHPVDGASDKLPSMRSKIAYSSNSVMRYPRPNVMLA